MQVVPKISFSLLSALNKQLSLEETLTQMTYKMVDMIHYDVTDKSPSLNIHEIDKWRKYTTLPFDVHLTAEKPMGFLKNFELKSDDYFALHLENNLTLNQFKKLRDQVGCKYGLALRLETSVTALNKFAPYLDYVLFMAADPGVSGGSFNMGVVPKIKEFHQKFPKISIHVDGGLDHYSAAVVRELHVDALISGSYLLNHDNAEEQIVGLFGRNLKISVDKLMRKTSRNAEIFPEATLPEVALAIENGHVGGVAVTDKRHHLLGFISDGDLRRMLVTKRDFNSLTAMEMMNINPFTIATQTTVIKLIREMEKMNKWFVVVPVVTKTRIFLGMLWLQDIMSEMY